jgi:alcohol dehydrogenase
MRAVGIVKYLPVTDLDCFVDVEVPTPAPTGRDLLVRVHAVSVNPVDYKMRSPRPDVLSAPKILGWDASGVVEAVGEGVALFKPGDAVYYAGSIVRPGCDSEYHLVDERIAGHKPASLSHEQAAAMPLTTLTAWEGMLVRLGIAPQASERNRGRRILVIAGAGGVGSIAIQLAKRVAGMQVIATASRPDTTAWCQRMGADHVINHRNPLAAELNRIGIADVDHVLCCSNLEDYVEQFPDVVAPFGSICSIVGMKDDRPVNVNAFFGKSLSLGFELMYTRSTHQTADMDEQGAILNEAARLLDAGVLQTTLTEHFGPLNAENLRRAHAKLESGAMIGKAVLSGI